jgi:T5SS/PEP-CTERM-associated repeat protein
LDLKIPFRISGGPYDYTFSGQIEHNISGNAGGANRVLGQAILFGPTAADVITIVHDDHLDGSGTLPVPRSGVLSVGTYSLNLGLVVFASAGPTIPAPSDSDGSFNFQFTLTPASGIIRWTQSTGGAFGTPENWEPQQVPVKDDTRNDTALFDLNNDYAVNIDGLRTIQRLVVRDGRVDFTDNLLTVSALSPTIPSVSIENDGRLNIATGGLLSVHAIIGNAPPQTADNPPTAEVLVSSFLGWSNTGNLAVGGAGKGRLFVANAGFVTSASATIGGPFGGEAIVGGQFSLWTTGNLAIGAGGSGEGSLDIEAGGKVNTGQAVLGQTPGATGEATITGTDPAGVSSSWITDSLTVGGADATGRLLVRDGGFVQTTQLKIADGAGSLGVVGVSGRNATGPGSTSRLIVLDGLTLGRGGSTAVMEVTDGGFVFVADGTMEVGQTSPADLLIAGGGTGPGQSSLVSVSNDLFVSNGTITIDHARLEVGGNLAVQPNGSIQGTGDLDMTNNGLFLNQGTVSPGLSFGRLRIDGNFQQSDEGVLNMEIGGLLPAVQHDQLAITGNASVDGAMNLIFIGGFAPSEGETFALLQVGGSFADAGIGVNIVNLLDGFEFDLVPQQNGLALVALNDGVYVPEPTATLTLLMWCGLVFHRRRLQVR